MKTASLAFVISTACFGATSLSVTTGTVSAPLSGAPWNNFHNQPMRWEMRLHGWGSGNLPDNGSLYGIGVANIRIGSTSGGTQFQAFVDGSDTAVGNGPVIAGCCTGHGDILVRVQRDVVGNRYTLEVFDTDSLYYASAVATITSLGTNWTTNPAILMQPNLDIAWVNWYSAVVPLGTALTAVNAANGDFATWAMNGSLNDSSTHALNMTGSGGGSHSFVATPVYSPLCIAGPIATIGGSTSSSTRAGNSLTLTSTRSAPLDGGSTLTYLWQMISGPSIVHWSSHTVAAPVVSGLVFGTYTAQLTLTDGSGDVSVCTAKYGSVATDSHGVVVPPSSSWFTAAAKLLGPVIGLGKNQWAWYDQLNPYLADLQIANANTFYGSYWNVQAAGTVSVTDGSATVTGSGTSFNSDFCNAGVPKSTSTAIIVWWVPASGPVGRREVTVASCGDDTHLTLNQVWDFGARNTTATAGSGASSVTVASATGISKYDLVTGTNIAPGTTVTSVSGTTIGLSINTTGVLSATAIHFGAWVGDGSGWNYSVDDSAGANTTGTAGSGASSITVASATGISRYQLVNGSGITAGTYVTSVSGTTVNLSANTTAALSATPVSLTYSGVWGYSAAPANYYDNVVAYYALYYRSGNTDYLTAARNLADQFWSAPQIDRGYACAVNNAGFCWPMRSMSMMGLVLRALDSPPNSMWPGLEIMWDTMAHFYMDTYYVQFVPDMFDQREQGYNLFFVDMCVMFDPNSVFNTGCQTSLSASFANIWTPVYTANATWPQLYVSGGGVVPITNEVIPAASWQTTMLHPSTSSVTLTNGSTAVTGNGTAWISNMFPASCTPGFDPKGCAMAFYKGVSPSVQPTANSQMDAKWYYPTWNSATSLSLDTPYVDATCTPSCTRGWLLADINTKGAIGFGDQPYMQGIIGIGFYFAYQALLVADPTNANLAKSYVTAISNWMNTTGYWSSIKSLYYIAGTVNCQPPISDANFPCTAVGNNPPTAGDIDAQRELSAETILENSYAFQLTNSSTFSGIATALYTGMYSKPGVSGPVGDGSYITALDTGGTDITGTPPLGTAPKWLGIYFGYTVHSQWPALVAGVLPIDNRTLNVGFKLASVPNATNANVILTSPAGAATTTNCSSSPCAVVADARQGNYNVQIQYLSAGAVVLSTGETFVMAVQ